MTRQELVQRRVDEPDRHRRAVHRPKQPLEVGALHRQQLREARVALGVGGREDHLLHHRQAVGLEEHVLGARQADALGAEAARALRVHGIVGVRPDAQPAEAVGPGEQRQQRRIVELGHDGLDQAGEHLAGRAVDRHRVAFAQHAGADGQALALRVDVERRGPDDGRLAELPRHQRRVARAAAARRQDAARREHAVHVVGLGLRPRHDDGLLLVAAPALGGVGVEHQHAGRGAGRHVEAAADQVAAGRRGLARGHRELRVQEPVDVLGRHPLHGLGAGDAPLVRQRDGDAHGRLRRALGVARLQHPQLAALDGELDVLHVAAVALERRAHAHQLAPHARHRLREGGDPLRHAGAGDHVLALRVGQPVALDRALARRDVARREDAGRGAGPEVAEHHRLDVDGGAEVVRDAGRVAVVDRALAVPGAEHRLHRERQLRARIGRERAPGARLHEIEERPRDGGEVVRGQLGVAADTARAARTPEFRLERLVRQPQHDRREHLDETPVRVVDEAAVAGQRDQPRGDGVVHPEVEHRVHHARHREPGARAARHQQRVRGVAEALAGRALEVRQRRVHAVPQPRRGAAARQVRVARLRRDDEAGRHRQLEPRHLGQVGALAAQQRLHRRVALGQQVDPLRCTAARRNARGRILRGRLARAAFGGVEHDGPRLVLVRCGRAGLRTPAHGSPAAGCLHSGGTSRGTD